jgi:hypothetical protein
VQSQPLFIIGAPRSGTTFLCNVLNQHPLIHITNESRIFVLVKDMMQARSKRPDLLGHEFRDLFIDFLHGHAGEMVERFYRKALGITVPIWGDKHPPYADPCVLSGRTKSQPRTPQSGSCLRLIRSSLPGAKFIHIHRDPRQVAHSLVRKNWTPSLDDGLNVWRQYVGEITEFLSETDPRRHLTIAYHDLLAAPEETSALIGRFLTLSDWSPITDFLLSQRQRPTPFSDPATDLRETYRKHPVRPVNGQRIEVASTTAERLGYSVS